MPVNFDQVEGVVQKAGDSTPAASGGSTEAPTPKSPQESFEETRQRMERLQRRLHAD